MTQPEVEIAVTPVDETTVVDVEPVKKPTTKRKSRKPTLPDVKVPKPLKKPKSAKKQNAMANNVKMTAWNVALREHGWFQQRDETTGQVKFSRFPQVGTPEHVEITATKLRLIAEWEQLGGIPEQYQKKITTDASQPLPRKKNPSKRTRTKAFAAALRKVGFLKENSCSDLPQTIKHNKMAKKWQQSFLDYWTFNGGVFPDDAPIDVIPKAPRGFEFTEDGVVERKKRVCRKLVKIEDGVLPVVGSDNIVIQEQVGDVDVDITPMDVDIVVA